MPDAKPPAKLKSELLGKDEQRRASILAAMPGTVVSAKYEHPEVWINGKHYAWEPGEEDGVPVEAVEIWNRMQEANA